VIPPGAAVFIAWGVPLLVGAVALRYVLRNASELFAWLGWEPYALRRRLRAGALLVAACALAIAWSNARELPPGLTSGADDLVLVIDVSQSMAVRDVPPSRLKRAARLAARIVDLGEGTRVGLVLFAGDAFRALPLTLDRRAVAPYLDALDTELISREGSDIGRAVERAGELFDSESERGRQILVISDGEHAGSSLEAASERLRAAGVGVFAIGMGTAIGGPVPAIRSRGNLEDERGREVRSLRRDSTLEALARSGGGRYWREWEERPTPAAILGALGTRDQSARHALEQRVSIACWVAWLALVFSVLATLQPRPAAKGRGDVPRALLPAAMLTVSLMLLGADAGERRAEILEGMAEGDARLEAGDPISALQSYRRLEDSGVESPELDLRIGNAHYRLGRFDRAAAYFLGVLRAQPPAPSELRFRAHFNLGNALSELGRFDEARDAFFDALAERPGHLETLFNYEWVLDRLEAEGESGAQLDPEAKGEEAMAELAGDPAGDPRLAPMDEAEAESWLSGLEDRLDDILRGQIERELRSESGARPPPGGQTW